MSNELMLYSRDENGKEIECHFKHPVDFREALSSGKYYRKGSDPEKGQAPDLIDIDKMTLEQLHQLAQFESLVGWKKLERADLVKALKAKRAAKAGKPEAPAEPAKADTAKPAAPAAPAAPKNKPQRKPAKADTAK